MGAASTALANSTSTLFKGRSEHRLVISVEIVK